MEASTIGYRIETNLFWLPVSLIIQFLFLHLIKLKAESRTVKKMRFHFILTAILRQLKKVRKPDTVLP